MSLEFELFWVISIAEWLSWLLPSILIRRFFSVFLMAAIAVVTGVIFYVHPNVFIGIFLIISLYRIINLLRLVIMRSNWSYLKRVTIQSSIWLVLSQILILSMWQISRSLNISAYHMWLILACLSTGLALILLVSTIRNLRKTTPFNVDNMGFADRDMPTLSVAIPARNETVELEECLESLIACNYPKLEIIVLDDCSQNKRTPEVIRSFAHEGVRFVEGDIPKKSWLPKNQAYQRLLDESNGQFILFCGVDVRFKPESLRLLVLNMIYAKKKMISVIPANLAPPLSVRTDSSLLQPIRYAWELSWPRKLRRRPPVLSTCWIIDHQTAQRDGGFRAVSRSITPESYFARLASVNDGYEFMRSSKTVGISTSKSFYEQRDTAIRTRYPQVHRRLEMVFLVSLFEILGIIFPYVLFIAAIFGHLPVLVAVVSLSAIILFVASYVQIVGLTYRRLLKRSFILLPAASLLDVILLNYSMIKYEFFEVIWKGRNICIPVMRISESSLANGDYVAGR